MNRSLRQMVVGLLALPLSVLPFIAYGMLTPEGRLVRDKLIVSLSPPRLPELNADQQAAAAAPRYRGKVMVLVYHGVGSASDGDGGFAVSPERFGEHLAMLRAAGMKAVTAAEVARAFAGGEPLPDNAVMITFDDGRADAFMFADPLLDEAGMKATMFIISSAADRPGVYYAGWGRVQAAARSGRWDIQAHTHASHDEQSVDGGASLPLLTSLAPGESLDDYQQRVEEDLERNSDAIEAKVGHRPVALAYPFGAYGAERTNDPRIREVLRQVVARHFALAFHQDDQDDVPLADPGQDRLGLRRLEVENWSGTTLLRRIARAAGQGASDSEQIADIPPGSPSVTMGHSAGAFVPVPEPAPEPEQPTAPVARRRSPTPTPSSTTTTTVPSSTSTTSTTVPPTTTTTTPPTTTTTTRPKTTTTTTTTTVPPTTTTTRCRGNNGNCK